MFTWQDVEKLKAQGHHEHAGALAFIIGRDDYYGCHFGTRSTYESAIERFHDGWRKAEYAYRQSR
jgi:hypothetical protein